MLSVSACQKTVLWQGGRKLAIKPHMKCAVAKHIKALHWNIHESQIIIRAPSLSKGTGMAYVMQDIAPY